MKETKYSIDLHENRKGEKAGRIVLGAACLAVTGWYFYSINGTAASNTTTWVAIAFLMLFGLWMIFSGLGYTSRYIIVAEDRITLRQLFYKPPVIFTPGSLRAVEFRPLTIIFITETGNVSLRLGTYWPENTARILEAVEEFCRHNSVEIRGDYTTEKGDTK
jgi:hypothetical protein